MQRMGEFYADSDSRRAITGQGPPCLVDYVTGHCSGVTAMVFSSATSLACFGFARGIVSHADERTSEWAALHCGRSFELGVFHFVGTAQSSADRGGTEMTERMQVGGLREIFIFVD
jgi:hypothetical protein